MLISESKILWIKPELCDPPHKITHWNKYYELINDINTNGWNGPALLGYKLKTRIQLISGSHRWAASLVLKYKIPVYLMSYNYVQDIYGTDEWLKMMKASPIIQNQL